MTGKQLTRRRFLGTSAGVLGGAALASWRGGTTASAQEFAGKTVSVATNDGELGNGVEAQMAAFEQATGAKIELTRLPADLSSGTGVFDVFIEPFIERLRWILPDSTGRGERLLAGTAELVYK